MVIFGIKEFHEIYDDLKIILKKLTPGRYRVPKLGQMKKKSRSHFKCNNFTPLRITLYLKIYINTHVLKDVFINARAHLRDTYLHVL